MTLNIKALVRYQEATRGIGKQTCFYKYSTDDDLATVLAAGYFNSARLHVKANDVVMAMVDNDGTPALAVFTFAAVPETGDVTTSLALQSVQQPTITDLSIAAVTGVDGTGSNAASKADVDTAFAAIVTKVNAILTNLESAGVNASA